MLYFAYGSNLNFERMDIRCPTAKAFGRAMLAGYQLVFDRVATLIPKEDASTPGFVWEIDEEAELSLDLYEGYPLFYRKEQVIVQMEDGTAQNVMVYLMNTNGYSLPPQTYLDIIIYGYEDAGLDSSYLQDGLTFTKEKEKETQEKFDKTGGCKNT